MPKLSLQEIQKVKGLVRWEWVYMDFLSSEPEIPTKLKDTYLDEKIRFFQSQVLDYLKNVSNSVYMKGRLKKAFKILIKASRNKMILLKLKNDFNGIGQIQEEIKFYQNAINCL